MLYDSTIRHNPLFAFQAPIGTSHQPYSLDVRKSLTPDELNPWSMSNVEHLLHSTLYSATLNNMVRASIRLLDQQPTHTRKPNNLTVGLSSGA